MNIEDKLPKADEILNYHYIHDRGLNNPDYVVNAMHEYAKRLLDVVARNAKVTHEEETDEDGLCTVSFIVDKQSILRFKELLK